MSTGDEREQDGSAEIATIEEAREEINAIERLLDGFSSTDELLEAIIRNQKTRLSMLLNDQRRSLPESTTGGRRRRLVPEGSVGIANRDIYENDDGPATFQVNGTVFEAEIQAEADIESSETIVIVDEENGAVPADGGSFSILNGGAGDTFSYAGAFRTVPSVVAPENDLKVENQKYADGEYQTVDGTLDPGESKTFAKLDVRPDQFLLFKYTNATAAESVEYEYYIDGKEQHDPDLSGSSPLAQPPDLRAVVPDGFMVVDQSVELVFN
jgi:hypothetical protein